MTELASRDIWYHLVWATADVTKNSLEKKKLEIWNKAI